MLPDDRDEYDYEYEEDACFKCQGQGYIVTCVDDLCHAYEWCIHNAETGIKWCDCEFADMAVHNVGPPF